MVVFLMFFTYAFLYDLKSVRKNTVQYKKATKNACKKCYEKPFFTLKKCALRRTEGDKTREP